MALGALIGAYQEDDSGALRALLPLAGRTLVEYQARCAAAAGAAPIVVVVERVPQALQDAFERLRLDSIGVFAVSDINEAISRFEAGSSILLIGDGVAPPIELVTRMADLAEPAVAVVPDDEQHESYERIDAGSRWAGVAMVDANLLGSTAAMLGDWDLQSTLLRRAIQEGAVRIQAADAGGEPLLAESAEQLSDFQRVLIRASRGARTDFASRYFLAPVEDFATERLMETPVRPVWLVWGALVMTLGGAYCFSCGWLGAGLIMLILASPMDLIASRLASLRMKPLPARMLARSALWPTSGLALLAIGLWEMRNGQGWGALVTAAAACGFAEAMRIEKAAMPQGGDAWTFSRRNAVALAIPFAIGGIWTSYLLGLLAYAAISFFIVQRVRHAVTS